MDDSVQCIEGGNSGGGIGHTQRTQPAAAFGLASLFYRRHFLLFSSSPRTSFFTLDDFLLDNKPWPRVFSSPALPTKRKMWYGLQRQILLKPGFGQNRPLKFPLGRSTPLRSFAGGVLPTEASKGHTTPGRTQPSHDIVSCVIGLALVLLELEKSDAPLPCNCILAPPLCELQHSRSQIRRIQG